MIEWERQIIHNMILVCDVLTEQVMVNCGRVPDLVVTKAQSICTTTPGTSWHRRWKRSSCPSMTTYRSQWDRWGWMISMVRGFTYAEKKQGSSCRVEDFMLFYMILQPIPISLVAISPVEMSVKMSTSPQVLALHHAARGSQGWDFEDKDWFGEAFCIFGLYTIERPSDCLSDDP